MPIGGVGWCVPLGDLGGHAALPVTAARGDERMGRVDVIFDEIAVASGGAR